MAPNDTNKKEPGWKSEATKARIRKAALEVFAKKGFAGSSTRMIANKARTNVALISRYFGGKEQLFKDIIRKKTENLVRGELDYPAQDSLRKEGGEFIDSMFRSFEANLDFFRIVASQSMVDRKFSVFLKEAIILQEDERLVARLVRLKENNLIGGNISPRDLALNIVTFVTGHVFYSFLLVGGSKVTLKESVEKFLDLICGATSG
ncbi:MAG: TetR/AcrR family transcriptional regulator [Bdellovibrionales bacterium]|nr:TetR/AcrR family transcriptional regulator [Bdellovibrionales bacterium]